MDIYCITSQIDHVFTKCTNFYNWHIINDGAITDNGQTQRRAPMPLGVYRGTGWLWSSRYSQKSPHMLGFDLWHLMRYRQVKADSLFITKRFSFFGGITSIINGKHSDLYHFWHTMFAHRYSQLKLAGMLYECSLVKMTQCKILTGITTVQYLAQFILQSNILADAVYWIGETLQNILLKGIISRVSDPYNHYIFLYTSKLNSCILHILCESLYH